MKSFFGEILECWNTHEMNWYDKKNICKVFLATLVQTLNFFKSQYPKIYTHIPKPKKKLISCIFIQITYKSLNPLLLHLSFFFFWIFFSSFWLLLLHTRSRIKILKILIVLISLIIKIYNSFYFFFLFLIWLKMSLLLS